MNEHLLELFDPKTCRSLRLVLKRWYTRNARDLPWRNSADPYAIWISEIMLQQTTVKAVVPYYERFLSRFPTVQDLAAASEEEVLQYWEGLGYYSRGRNLRRAAQKICEIHGGQFPSGLVELQALPGIGRYTAGAIRSFGFDLPAPIVEANTLRLYCRLLGYAEDPRSRVGENLLWSLAERFQPRHRAGHLNQALMELGAVICTPVTPKCDLCPVVQFCQAFRSGRQASIPAPKIRPQVTQLVEGTIAVQQGMKWLVRQRTSRERWAGMWDFPRFPLTAVTATEHLTNSGREAVQNEAAIQLQEQCGLAVKELQEVMQIRHSVTRYRIRLICFRGELVTNRKRAAVSENCRWVTSAELQSLPMPVTGRQFLVRLEQVALAAN